MHIDNEKGKDQTKSRNIEDYKVMKDCSQLIMLSYIPMDPHVLIGFVP